MFKHLCAYRLTAPWTMTAEHLAESLSRQAFQPCLQYEMESSGWTAPIEGGPLVHTVNSQILIQLTTEAKILPASVINQHTKVRAVELEEQQGFKLGRKQMEEIREIVTDELLPRALCKRSNLRIWIDPVNGWLVIDTSAANRADFVFKILLKSLDVLPFASLRTMRSPLSAMTDWLAMDEPPEDFTIDRDAELRAVHDQSKGKLKYTNLTIESEDVRTRIAGGMQCVQLAMTYADRISFVLTEGLILKRLHFLDIVRENVDAYAEKNEVERFDADFMIMADEGNKLLTAVVAALGGVDESAANIEASSAITLKAGSDGEIQATPADLYAEAEKIVVSHGRASVSLIQRHLRIDYNQAARLMDQMEQNGVVGPMNSTGARQILTKAA